MSSETARDLAMSEVRARAKATTLLDEFIRPRMTNVREAFRMHRLARDQRRLCDLYDEHNLFEEARKSRRDMMHLLCTARTFWRRALGFSPDADG